MTAFHTGLVVGKFAPLHRGHQLLLDHASARCEHLIILSYTKPEFPGNSPGRREAWLRALNPAATVLVLDDDRLEILRRERDLSPTTLPHNDDGDEAHRQFCAWVLRELLGQRVDVVFTSESYGDGFADVLAREQGGSSPVVHEQFDPQRIRIPISASRIRGDVHAHRNWLAPLVYASFVQRIALLGGESTGKTTLAAALAAHLDTLWVPEYGRELWEARGGQLQLEDMLLIAETQVSREENLAAEANRYLICDTTPLTTLFYSEELFAHSDDRLEELAQRRYDRVFLCDADFDFVQDGTRQTREFQARQQAWYERRLRASDTDFAWVSGALDARVAKIFEIIG